MSAQPAAEQIRWGFWRVVAPAPTIASSCIVVLVFAGALGPWAEAVWLGWLAFGLLTLGRAGERWFVQLGWGFRRLGAADRTLLEPVWSDVLDRTGVSGSAVDLYVQRGSAVNAYAVGGRSVAVSAPLVAAYRSGVLRRAGVAAVLAHEIGHSQTGGVRCLPLDVWLSLPWRVVYRSVSWIGHRTVGRQPLLPLSVVAGVVVVTADVELIRTGAWSAAVILTVLGCSAAISPVVDAAMSRADEYAADRFAAAAGYAPDLARVLEQIDDGGGRRTLGDAAVARHPTVQDRITRLARAAGITTRRGLRGLA